MASIPMVSSDACFICLHSSRSRVCGRCSIHAHTKCWTTFLEHGATGFHIDNRRCVKCPQCADTIILEPYNTRSVAEAVHTRTKFIQTIKQGMVAINEESTEARRSMLSCDLFEYICQHVSVIATYSKLLEVIEEKLQDLHADGWAHASTFHARLFRVPSIS
jgi:hypothetical protein